MNVFQLQWVNIAFFTGTHVLEEKEGDLDDIPLKKTKYESLIAAESDEDDPTPGHKIAVTNLVVNVAS